MPVLCRTGCGKNAVLKVRSHLLTQLLSTLDQNLNKTTIISSQRPKTGDALCKECFYNAFETEIHYTITKGELFNRGDSVAVAASGGKDSTVLAHVMKTLNERYDYGLNLVLLSIDEGRL